MGERKWAKVSADAVEKERSTCGFRQRLFKKDDGVPASITRLKTDRAQAHWHRHTHEYYFVLVGEGRLIIDGDEVPVGEGDCVWIRPGAMHHAEGELESLIVAMPAFDPADMFLDPPPAE